MDDRGSTKKTLTPELYDAILDEAHKHNVSVGVHNVTLADAKEMMRHGMEGWLHVPVRGGEAVDDELISIVKQRVANNDRPVMWVTPAEITAWMDAQGGHPGRRAAWLDDPLLGSLYSPEQIEEYWGQPLAKKTSAGSGRGQDRSSSYEGNNLMKLRAAGMRDGRRHGHRADPLLIGFFNHLDLESMVAMGMTPIGGDRGGHARRARKSPRSIPACSRPGKQADFIVLDANPLDSISNTRKINKVYLRGQEVPRAAMAAKWQAKFRQTASAQ